MNYILSTATRDLIARLRPERNYGPRSYAEIVAGIHDGRIIIEEPREGDPPVLTDLEGKLLKGTGRRPGMLSSSAMGLLSWNYPRSYVDAREALEGATFSDLRQRFRAGGL